MLNVKDRFGDKVHLSISAHTLVLLGFNSRIYNPYLD